MANSMIAQYLNKILKAVYGKDVRQAIHDSIKQCYDDVNNPSLNTAAFETAVQNKIDSGELAAMTLGDGSVTSEKLADDVLAMLAEPKGLTDYQVSALNGIIKKCAFISDVTAEYEEFSKAFGLDLNELSMWEIGGLQPNGSENNSTTSRLRTITYIPKTVKKISVDEGYSYIIVCYSADGKVFGTRGYYNPHPAEGNSFLTDVGTYYEGDIIVADIATNINSIYGNTMGSDTYNNYKIILRNENLPESKITVEESSKIHLWK